MQGPPGGYNNGQQMGGPPMGGPQMGGPQMGGPQMGGPQMGGPQMGGPQMGMPPQQWMGGGPPGMGGGPPGMGGAAGPMRHQHGGGGGMMPYGNRGGGKGGGKGGKGKGADGVPNMGGRWGGGTGVGGRGRFERAKNDYAQHFVDTGLRPANFIRDSDVQERFEEYPKLKELIQAKDAKIAERATAPTYKKVDLKTFNLTTLGTKFDVILIDPPWEEYRRRKIACGGEDAEETEVWKPEEIMNLRIDQIADTPSFCFLWSGSGVSLDWGRACLRKWGYRRCEDISWIKSNRDSVGPDGRGRNYHWLPDSVITATAEHCLVGIKGTVRRNYDGDKIHANVDTDVMLSEEPPYGATDKPSELYAIIEHFAQGRRRLELFGEDTNIRRGWLTLGDALSSSNHDAESWAKNFEGQVESHNFEDEPPQLLPNHLNGTTPLIESLRPKSPTQLREEAERRQRRQYENALEAQRKSIEEEQRAALEMGIEIAPRAVQPIMPPPQLPKNFKEQSPFMAPDANRF